VRTNRLSRIILLSALLGTSSGWLKAQSVELADARAMGMARGSMASARGIDAAGLNPANLGLRDRSAFSFGILPLGGHLGTNFMNWGEFYKYFSGVETKEGKKGKYLSDAEKQNILNNFPDGKGNAFTGGAVTLFAFSFVDEELGGFAFTVNERFGVSGTIPSDYVRFLFYGNPLGSKYEFSGTEANGQWLREYALHYGRALPSFVPHSKISAGISLKLVHGFAYGAVEDFSGSILTDTNSVLTAAGKYSARRSAIDTFNDSTGGNYILFPAPAGVGFGFDMGATAQIGGAFTVGLSVIDIGSISWSRNAREYNDDESVTVTGISEQAQRDSITDSFKSIGHPVASFSTPLPTALRFGFAVGVDQLPFMNATPGTLTVELDYIQGLNTQAGNTTSPKFALGVEYHPLGWLPLRTGLAVSGNENVHWALGGGLNFSSFDLEAGTEDIIAFLAPDHMSVASFALGMRIRF
jgi:hypothetical protein